MAQCSAQTGIPLHVLKFAKAQGAPGFEHGRVKLEPVLRWIMEHADDLDASGINWNRELTKYRSKREEIKLGQDRTEVISREQVAAGVDLCREIIEEEMVKTFVEHLPALLVGRDERGIHDAGREAIEQLKETLRTRLSTL